MTPPQPLGPHRYTATITACDGWWFRYRVERMYGFAIFEHSISHHRTMKGARRAARAWTRRNHPDPVVVERYL